MPKAYFACKAPNLEDARAQISAAKRDGATPMEYYIAESKTLENQRWQDLADTLLHDRFCFAEHSRKEFPPRGLAIPCFRIENQDTGAALIIDTEGYPYARYTAIEDSFEIDDEDEDEDDEPEIDEGTLQDALIDILYNCTHPEEAGIYTRSVRSYSDAGVMTYNKGLVITLADGSEFQLTIVQSR